MIALYKNGSIEGEKLALTVMWVNCELVIADGQDKKAHQSGGKQPYPTPLCDVKMERYQRQWSP